MQHVAFNVDSLDDLLALRDRIRDRGVNVFGPLDHGMCHSIYFAGPEHLTLEIATSAVPIDDRAWIDPEVVALCGIDDDELGRDACPGRRTRTTAARCRTRRSTRRKPHLVMGTAESYAKLMAMPDEVVTAQLSEPDPPVRVEPLAAAALTAAVRSAAMAAPTTPLPPDDARLARRARDARGLPRLPARRPAAQGRGHHRRAGPPRRVPAERPDDPRPRAAHDGGRADLVPTARSRGREAPPIYYGDAHPTGDRDGDFHPPAGRHARRCRRRAAARDRRRRAHPRRRRRPRRRRVTTEHRRNVRWILVHMVEEYARHCGHADLLREAIDGVTDD